MDVGAPSAHQAVVRLVRRTTKRLVPRATKAEIIQAVVEAEALDVPSDVGPRSITAWRARQAELILIDQNSLDATISGAKRIRPSEMLEQACDLLSPSLVAYILDFPSTAEMRRWVQLTDAGVSTTAFDGRQLVILWMTHGVARYLDDRGHQAIGSWFIVCNDLLGGGSPAEALRAGPDGRAGTAFSRVWAAAEEAGR